MIALGVVQFALYEQHPLLAIITRRFVVPIGVGTAIGHGLSYLPEWATIAFVIFANVVAAICVWRIIVITRRGPHDRR